jgi:hypothetical protein
MNPEPLGLPQFDRLTNPDGVPGASRAMNDLEAITILIEFRYGG